MTDIVMVKHTRGGRGILLPNGRVFCANDTWHGTVSWVTKELTPVGPPDDALYARYVKAVLIEGEQW